MIFKFKVLQSMVSLKFPRKNLKQNKKFQIFFHFSIKNFYSRSCRRFLFSPTPSLLLLYPPDDDKISKLCSSGIFNFSKVFFFFLFFFKCINLKQKNYLRNSTIKSEAGKKNTIQVKENPQKKLSSHE